MHTIADGYAVRIFIFSGGERRPLLLRNGIPQFYPTQWVSVVRRPCRVAFRTIKADLETVMLALKWAQDRGFDLEKRLLDGDYLSDGEITDLVDRCNRRHERTGKVLPLCAVGSRTYTVRLTRLREYCDWVAGLTIARLATDSRPYADLDAARKAMAKAFNIRLDVPRERRTLHQREGLSIEVFDRLVVAVRPDAANNPWGDRVVSIRDAVRARNQAMVLTTALLGLRRGELLGLKVQDVWMTGTIPRLLIARRADDPDDPRPDQPTAKTGDGVVELPSALSDLLEDYIFNVRAKTPGAKRHPYIWVGHKPGRNLGQPLAMVSLTALYRRLRENVDGLPPDLSGHVLRHTWNDRFSQLCDQSKVPEEKEKLIRNYLMRWTPTSDTAVRYTRRHVRDKANEFSMRHQGDMLERAGLDVRGVLQGEKQNSQ